MIIYRAMSNEEAEKTIENGKPHFIKRKKWFSPDLSFIRNRVQDREFNNSKFKPNRYERVFAFSVDNLDKSDFSNHKEIQFDRRKNPKIELIGEYYGNRLPKT